MNLIKKEILTCNCGVRIFAGRATEAGASQVALDNNLATTIDNSSPGAGILQVVGQPAFVRFYFSKFSDLDDYYKKRGLTKLGYSQNEAAAPEELDNLDGDVEIDIQKDKVEYQFEDEKAEIDKRKDQKWEEI